MLALVHQVLRRVDQHGVRLAGVLHGAGSLDRGDDLELDPEGLQPFAAVRYVGLEPLVRTPRLQQRSTKCAKFGEQGSGGVVLWYLVVCGVCGGKGAPDVKAG